jgi:hypothetical protein
MHKPTSRTEVRNKDKRGKQRYLVKKGEFMGYVTGVQHGEEYERDGYKIWHAKSVHGNT